MPMNMFTYVVLFVLLLMQHCDAGLKMEGPNLVRLLFVRRSIGGDSKKIRNLSFSRTAHKTTTEDRLRMTSEDVPEGSKGEVWMLDTFGNVHSLVNACKQLGFKVNRITSPHQ